MLGSDPDHPGLVCIYKDLNSPPDHFENAWHCDATWREKPPMGAVLRCLECPPVGGDTIWANMARAYEDLADHVKDAIDGLYARHSIEASLRRPHADREAPRAQGAIFRTPSIRSFAPIRKPARRCCSSTASRRTSPTSTPRRTSATARIIAPGGSNLLNYLIARAAIPEYQVRWRWRPNSVAIWDNRCTQHYAVMDYWPAVRKMERAGSSATNLTEERDKPCSSWTTACCPKTRIRWSSRLRPTRPASCRAIRDDIPVSMKDQVQKAVDCYNAGATVLHVHVREPDGKGSKRLEMFNEMLDRLRTAVPKMILQVGGSISFAPKDEGEAAKWLGDDTRHMLAELNPKPDQVTIAINTNQMNVMELITDEDAAGTSMGEPDYKHAYTEMYYESGPGFVKEHLKRLVGAGIQPHFMIGSIKDLETVERIVRQGQYMGPYVLNWVSIGGGHDGPESAQPDGIHQPRSAERRAHGRGPDAPRLSALHHGHRHGPARTRRPGRQSLWPPRRARDLGPADREDGADSAGAVASDRDRRAGAPNLQDRHLLLEHRRDA